MNRSLLLAITAIVVPCANADDRPRPYRLQAVDLKQPVIWGAECREPEGAGLAFGGQDQNAEDGRPHTRVLVEGRWTAIDAELREANPLDEFRGRVWRVRGKVRDLLARCRAVYFRGLPADEEATRVSRTLGPVLVALKGEITQLAADIPTESGDEYVRGQATKARESLVASARSLPALDGRLEPATLSALHGVQVRLELAGEMLAAEPPARAMDCGAPRRPGGKLGPVGESLVYDPGSKLYVLFGGDHLDYLTNDTWVFDPAKRRWFQRHPEGAPPPRANHRLEVVEDGTIRLTGGYTYSSSTGYISGQYVDLDDGEWTYDIAADTWSHASGEANRLAAPDARTYRTGPFHPEFYVQGERPDASEFERWLARLPANEWTATNPPHLPRLNRDWGTARVDPGRDLLLRWSGGHSAHGGTDVLHYHFATNRWELPFPVEFPLGQLYSNTSYPNGFNFNRRPWMTGHTYQNYDYDPPSRTLVKAGRPRHFYVYDPDVGDWIGRGVKPAAMQYNSCFYTLTLAATSQGVVCWDRNGRVHRYEHAQQEWRPLALTGDDLPGAYVDNSTIAYDSKRDRLLIVNTLGYRKPFDGSVWSVDLRTLVVRRLVPGGAARAERFANVDKCCYDAENDLLLMGTYLVDAGERTRTPAYDCERNEWITLDLKYETGRRLGNVTRAFPHSRSDGMVHDPRRNLVWGVNTNGQVYVLRLDRERADPRKLD